MLRVVVEVDEGIVVHLELWHIEELEVLNDIEQMLVELDEEVEVDIEEEIREVILVDEVDELVVRGQMVLGLVFEEMDDYDIIECEDEDEDDFVLIPVVVENDVVEGEIEVQVRQVQVDVVDDDEGKGVILLDVVDERG